MVKLTPNAKSVAFCCPDCGTKTTINAYEYPFACKCGRVYLNIEDVKASGAALKVRPFSKRINTPHPVRMEIPKFMEQPQRRMQCSLLGSENGRELCQACKGKVEIKTHDCPLHGRCTIAKKINEVSCCAICRDWTQMPPPPPEPRISAVTEIRMPVHSWPKTVLVLGAYRGGTSFVSGLLREIGVYMGKCVQAEQIPGATYENHEDREIWAALDELRIRRDEKSIDEQWEVIRGLIAARDAEHSTWGFKAPASVFYIDKLLTLVRNPHLVVVLRDPLASLQSDPAHGKSSLNWSKVRHHMATVMDVVEKPRAPTTVVSYERGKDQQMHVREKLRAFVGNRPQRNLIYHIAPLKNNDLWERNVEQLMRRIDVFDGKCYIAIATGAADLLHSPDYVRAKIKRLTNKIGIEFVQVPNDRRLREVASFRILIERVNTRSSDQVTFYAHTKGNSTYDDARGALYWRNMMYHKLLDGWESCMDTLVSHKMAGTTKMNWSDIDRSPFPSAIQNTNKWMYAGTFFWFRNDAVFSNPKWDQIQNDRYGAEAWPGEMFESEECATMFQPWPERKFWGVSPYDPELYAKHNLAIEDCELKHPAYQI